MGMGNFEWKGVAHCKVQELCKTAEPIEMPFGSWGVDSGGPKETCIR